MNAENKITIKHIRIDNFELPSVITSAIGNPSQTKVLEVIKSYEAIDHEIIGAFMDDILIGALGICKENEVITIRHIALLQDFQRRGIGTLLLDFLKKCYERYRIIAETDGESVDFYSKSGFTCHKFKGRYGNLRYKCEFSI
ncbi:GNAT family N-acetyltransferase domain protein [Candidatus Trichorickettsia mobilis]|uniref:GNAT family N-acetyltransferase domain protein n=1 Tax=Candidatus Trichorickettsia mobilis TaxID=1346319 RepID=A0ABZ0URR1_9RICK|nr:GNAT family N-acetyltransferase [Candidatus Trichorickettsia mobilis]WPY00720.1 GNAT family N-acetyltransferase domain protein [Candidatus Trichorickettsia mobilis]